MNRNEQIRFSVVIPAFNEEAAISQTLQSLIDHLKSRFTADDYEVIVVDDGSSDFTAEKAGTISGVKVLRLPENMGYGAAIKNGVRAARFEWIFIMDSDGQHRLENMDEFIETAKQGYEMVIGGRRKSSFKLWYRQPAKQVMNLIANILSDVKIPDLNSGMRLFRKSVFLRYEPLYPNGFSISTTLTLAAIGDGYPVKFIPITTYERIGRRSNVRFVRDGLNTMVNIVRAISLFNPLKVFVPASILCNAVGLYYGIENILLVGRISRTSIVCITVGVLLFLFGILADQLALLRKQHRNFNTY